MSSEMDSAIAELKTMGASPVFLKDLIVNRQIFSESDRSIVVLSGAYIDENLSLAIKANLIGDEKVAADLLDPGKAAGDFASRNKMAYLMGLYGKEIYDELKHIASIRNDFAHKVEISSFDHEIAKGKIMSLRLVRSSVRSEGLTIILSPKLGNILEFKCGEDNGSSFSDPKMLFNTTVSVLVAALQSVTVKAPRMGQATN